MDQNSDQSLNNSGNSAGGSESTNTDSPGAQNAPTSNSARSAPNTTGDSTNSSSSLNESLDTNFVRNINNLLRQTAQRLRSRASSTSTSSQDAPGNTPAPGAESNPTSNPSTNGNTTNEPSINIPGIPEEGAIVITINYVFSDENNPLSPNRSGSLVLTLPNNPSNRNPQTLQEFIRLATQMAYSTIVNLFQNEKKGLTLEKFKSFPLRDPADIDEKTCSICLEDFEKANGKAKREREEDEETSHSKRRKVGLPTSETTENKLAPSSSSSTTAEPEYLKDCTTEFSHLPVELPCKHIFGQLCLAEWLKTQVTCPLCREVVEKQDENAGNSGPNFRVLTQSGLNEHLNSLAGGGASATANATPGSNSTANATAPAESSETVPNNEILALLSNYFRRNVGELLFPSGVESRRTRNGVTTTTTPSDTSAASSASASVRPISVPIILSTFRRPTESPEDTIDYLNLRSLTDDQLPGLEPPAPPNPSTRQSESPESDSDLL